MNLVVYSALLSIILLAIYVKSTDFLNMSI